MLFFDKLIYELILMKFNLWGEIVFFDVFFDKPWSSLLSISLVVVIDVLFVPLFLILFRGDKCKTHKLSFDPLHESTPDSDSSIHYVFIRKARHSEVVTYKMVILWLGYLISYKFFLFLSCRYFLFFYALSCDVYIEGSCCEYRCSHSDVWVTWCHVTSCDTYITPISSM